MIREGHACWAYRASLLDLSWKGTEGKGWCGREERAAGTLQTSGINKNLHFGRVDRRRRNCGGYVQASVSVLYLVYVDLVYSTVV